MCRRRFAFFSLLVALVLFTRPLAAQTWEDFDYENLEFRGIGIDVGWVVPPRVDNVVSLGLRLDLGYLGPNLRVRPGIGFWSSQMRQDEVDRLAAQIQNVCRRQRDRPEECPLLQLGRIRMSDLMFNADAQYEFPHPRLIPVPFLGLGTGIHLLNGRGEAIDDTFIEDFLDSISPSLNLFGGARLPLTDAFELTGELRYVLSSDIRHAAFTAGATWLFPTRTQTAPQPTAARAVR